MPAIQFPPADYVPHDAFGKGGQIAFHNSHARFISLSSGTRAGKSIAAAVEFVLRILDDASGATPGKPRQSRGTGKDREPSLHYWVVSPTVALLRITKRYLMRFIPRQLFANPLSPINSEGQCWLVNNILIEFKSADNPLGLVGVGLDGAWMDEAARVKAEAWKGNLRGRLAENKGWCIFSSTPLGRNWYYQDVVALGESGPGKRDGHDSFTWFSADNPHVPREEVEEARATLPPRYFKREWEANFDAFNGNVYEEFSEAIHVINERPPPSAFRGFYVGLDFGWNSPGAALLIGDLGNGNAVALDEIYRSNMDFFDPRMNSNTWTTEIAKMLLPWGRAKILYDPSGAENGSKLSRNGFFASPAENDVVSGIRDVATALHPVNGRPRLRIWKGCINLIHEMRKYIWSVSKTGEFLEYPADGQADHLLDACRYGLNPIVAWMRPGGTTTGRQQGAGRPIG